MQNLVQSDKTETENLTVQVVGLEIRAHNIYSLSKGCMKIMSCYMTYLYILQVKVHPSVREVVAVYKVDEARMELSIQLPNNYPLGPVRVESGKQLVDAGQWRNWMMQLTVFLTHQVQMLAILFIQ
jgi:hypothetical protein